MINYAASWLINFVVFAIIVAVIDEAYENSIEKNQLVGAFLLFGMPTIIEIASYLLQQKPLFFSF